MTSFSKRGNGFPFQSRIQSPNNAPQGPLWSDIPRTPHYLSDLIPCSAPFALSAPRPPCCSSHPQTHQATPSGLSPQVFSPPGS